MLACAVARYAAADRRHVLIAARHGIRGSLRNGCDAWFHSAGCLLASAVSRCKGGVRCLQRMVARVFRVVVSFLRAIARRSGEVRMFEASTWRHAGAGSCAVVRVARQAPAVRRELRNIAWRARMCAPHAHIVSWSPRVRPANARRRALLRSYLSSSVPLVPARDEVAPSAGVDQ